MRYWNEHPELLEQIGAENAHDYLRGQADRVRKEQKENGPDDREMCRACGEFPIREGGMYCRKCNASIDEERENRT